MSITPLTQLFDETRRLAIAGSTVAPGDFRLQKLIPALQQVGQKAPVFARLADAASAVVDSNEHSAAPNLLTLSTLINAVLYTQGETGKEGELTPLAAQDYGIAETQAPASVLKPLLEALTSKGAGRLEIIQEAFQQKAFCDLRLIRPTLAALNDRYGEISEFIADQVLPSCGKAILPALLAEFNPKGKAADARRLRAIAKIDPIGCRDLLLTVMKKGSRDTKLVAVSMLGHHPDDIPLLLEQLQPKFSEEIRQAATIGLVQSAQPAAVAAVEQMIAADSELETITRTFQQSENPALVPMFARQLREAVEQLRPLRGEHLEAEQVREADRISQRLSSLLDCIAGRPGEEVESLISELFEDRENLAATRGVRGGGSLVEQLAAAMAAGTDAQRRRLAESHPQSKRRDFGHAFITAGELLSPAELYDEFAPYLTAPNDNQSASENRIARKQRDTIVGLIMSGGNDRHFSWMGKYRRQQQNLFKNLDSRWLDAAVAIEYLPLAQAVARPGHLGLHSLLERSFEEAFARPEGSSIPPELLQAMVIAEHPSAADAVYRAIGRCTSQKFHTSSLFWYGRLIAALPPEHAPRFVDLMNRLPSTFAAQISDAVAALKAKAAS